MLVDTHLHLDDGKYREDLEKVLDDARGAGVAGLVTIGTNLEDSTWAAGFAAGREGVWAAVGVHPEHAGTWREEDFDAFRALARGPKVRAVGEVGLDYHHGRDRAEIQQAVFRRMIALGAECGLPLVIHQRDAAEDTLAILRQEGAAARGGVFHCFAGDWDTARQALEMGFFLAVGGILTFPSAAPLREVIRQVPMDRLVLETDAPWLAPQGRRGKRNEPAFLPEVAARLAELKGLDAGEVERRTTENAQRLFGIQTVTREAR